MEVVLGEESPQYAELLEDMVRVWWISWGDLPCKHPKRCGEKPFLDHFPAKNHVFFPHMLFPTCQVRVVRFYVSCLLLSSPLLLLLVVLLVLLVQLRPAIHSVLCRTSTTTIHAQCSLPDLNREYPCQVFPAGPQP